MLIYTYLSNYVCQLLIYLSLHRSFYLSDYISMKPICSYIFLIMYLCYLCRLLIVNTPGQKQGYGSWLFFNILCPYFGTFRSELFYIGKRVMGHRIFVLKYNFDVSQLVYDYFGPGRLYHIKFIFHIFMCVNMLISV